VVAGASADLDGERLLADARRICEAQIQFWHSRRKPDFDHYVFMLNAVEDGYGGLEHRQSTALICARKDLPRKGRPLPTEAYQTLLGLISHE
ncbi:M61 family peptidase, partial [Acinetobacter baumannii]